MARPRRSPDHPGDCLFQLRPTKCGSESIPGRGNGLSHCARTLLERISSHRQKSGQLCASASTRRKAQQRVAQQKTGHLPMNTLRFIFFCILLTTPLHIQAQETEPVPRMLFKTKIHIRSEPTGAQVFINGQEAGYTPFVTEKLLDIGDKIQAYAHGYQPWTRTFTTTVLADTVHIALIRQKAHLEIRSDQLAALGAEIHLRFADQDTTITGFINIGRGNVAYESDLFVGKYRLEISKPGFNLIEQDLFLPPRGKLIEIRLTRNPLPLTELSIPGLVDIADQYLAESAQLLEAALAIGETVPAVETNASIRLSDSRLTPFIEDLKYYSHQTRELELTLSRLGQSEIGVLRALAQIDVYHGIVLGKYRRFSEAHALFREARERSPFPIEQEPNPLPGENESSLGDLTRFAEQWHTRLGRLDVNVNAAWLAIRNMHPNTLRFEQVRFTREAPVPPATSPHEQAMYDSLTTLAEHILNENIANREQEFSLTLPKGHYMLKDTQNMAIPISFRVSDAPTFLPISPRVSLWLPTAKTASDTVRLQTVVGDELGPIVQPDQITFGREYALLVKMGDYKRHRENIILYPASGIKPVWPGVTAIAATPGTECLYYKTGNEKLETSILGNIQGKRSGLLKYLLLPIVGIGVALAL
ncbi:MAG: PEGA domain-containing protein [Gemmatimonadetes bacterium]|nr:PEGA domain-containing protein [Gemmatimonadota bacterium]MYF75258.1 PEGA domain-containing protein [Gemmatimonadota bacterium]MYK52257.1 PEGA domain-containing protein [Gemmatimonadota bacterium]